jgi:hypothetical protein
MMMMMVRWLAAAATGVAHAGRAVGETRWRSQRAWLREVGGTGRRGGSWARSLGKGGQREGWAVSRRRRLQPAPAHAA